MKYSVAKICVLVAIAQLSITEWVEIAHTKSKSNGSNILKVKPAVRDINSEDFTTPSSVWVDYQRERFGVSNSKPLVVSDAGGLKTSAQIVVPSNSQVINARTKLVVKNTESPPVNVNVMVTPKVETTSRRHSVHLEESFDETAGSAELETATEQSENIQQQQQATENDDESQLPSMQGFLKFLKTMQSTWIKKSALSIENKIKLLRQIRDNLMKVIEQQFSVLWQPAERHKRKKRGLLDESNLEFPPEAALITINFLTFAVFLIKLVLQVVKIVKSKHYSFTGFNVNTQLVRRP